MNYLRRAKTIMRDLQALGHFDEFSDHRERDGLNAEAAEVIADRLAACARAAAQGEK